MFIILTHCGPYDPKDQLLLLHSCCVVAIVPKAKGTFDEKYKWYFYSNTMFCFKCQYRHFCLNKYVWSVKPARNDWNSHGCLRNKKYLRKQAVMKGIDDVMLGNSFRITGPLWGDPPAIGRSSQRANDAELICFCCWPEHNAGQVIEMPMIWDTMTLM